MKRHVSFIAICMLLCLALTGCGSKAIEEGTTYLEDGNYKKAVTKFKEAADKGQDTGEAYRGIGMAKWELGEYEAALSAFQSALDNGAEKTAALYNFLGSCELKLDNPKEALNYYNLGQECDDASKELMQEMKYNEIVAYLSGFRMPRTYDESTVRKKLKEYVKDYPDDERGTKEAEFLETQ